MKTIAIMQPYFLPYIGYWQLMSSVDLFIVYDNIQYTKKGWFNRNQILMNGKPLMFTIPLQKDSDYLDVCQRFIVDDIKPRTKILNQLKNAYSKAPMFSETYPLMHQLFKLDELYDGKNLFEFIYNSILKIKEKFNIKTEIIKSSLINIDHSLKSQDKVIALCKAVNANRYINMINGAGLYSSEDFNKAGLKLSFLKQHITEYKQFNNDFVPYLSILDMMMFNDKQTVINMMNEYTLH